MPPDHSSSWYAPEPLRTILVATCVLVLLTPAHGGTQIAPHERPEIGAPIELSPPPPSDMALDPIEPVPLQRIDPRDLATASDIDALTRIADSPAAQTPPGRQAPPGSSANMAAGTAAWTLGLIYLHGAGVPQDPGQAQQWFERALALGERQALAGGVSSTS